MTDANETRPKKSSIPAWGIGIFIVVAMALGILAGRFGSSLLSTSSVPEVQRATVLVPGKELDPFTLVDHSGQDFSRDELSGKWSILFFGFTHCPDVCPTTLHSLSQFADNIAKSGYAADTQVLFVSVDPERDTPEQLAGYVPFFNPDFIGLTGTPDAIEKFTRNLGIAFLYGVPNENGGYTVDHSAAILVINPDAEMKAVFSPPHDVAILTQDYLAIRKAS
jgi:protein SCO1/2